VKSGCILRESSGGGGGGWGKGNGPGIVTFSLRGQQEEEGGIRGIHTKVTVVVTGKREAAGAREDGESGVGICYGLCRRSKKKG